MRLVERSPQPEPIATADKKEKPSAKRRNTELEASRILEPAYFIV